MQSPNDTEPRLSDDSPSIPSIDLHAFLSGTPKERKTTASKVDGICRSVGFLMIKNHGIANAVVNHAWSASKEFFDLPLEEKLKSRPSDPTCPRGYFPMASEALARSLGVETPPDVKESFGIGPLRTPPLEMDIDDLEFHYGDNIWPAAPPDLRVALTTYFNAMQHLGSQILRLLAAALELRHDFFERFHTHPMFALRCINYPAANEPLLPQQKGAGEHSDYGSITILKSDPDVPGLEIKLPSGRWAEAPMAGDEFIINIGDMMARWTNDRWVSTLHRVIQPGTEDSGASRRQSLAFFHNTGFDARIECIPTCLPANGPPKYKTVLAGKYLMERFTSAVN